MEQKSVWREFPELPPEAQRQVIELIASLRKRDQTSRSVKKPPLTDLTKEAFVGIWNDRQDFQDSSEWVRDLRKHDWIRPRA